MGQQRDKYILKESKKCVSSVEPRQGADYFVGGVISIVWKELLEAPPEDRACGKSRSQSAKNPY